MTLVKIPGFVGYKAARVSSFDGRAIGKLTDTNHLYSLRSMAPSDYDKKIISIYTQTATYNNDFWQMISKSSVYYPDTEVWKWDITVPYMYPTIVDIPMTTTNLAKPGIDGQKFQIVLDKKSFFIHDTITPDRRYGPQWYVTDDPVPYNNNWLYTLTLNTTSPLTDYVTSNWLQVGLNVLPVGNVIGEFDDKLSGLPELGSRITLYETMAGGYGKEHTVTKWADTFTPRNEKGQPLDIITYNKYRVNEAGQVQILDTRWEPMVEQLIRKEMMELKVRQMIWSKPGTVRTGGNSQEVKKTVEGLYWKMRNNGNLVQYPRGEFSLNIFRNTFGDLFYRRVDMANRRVKVYTNEAGFDVFDNALQQDLLNSGFTIVADNRFIEGSGRNMTLNYAFSSAVTRETGRIELVHLKELDEPQTNLEYGQNKKSTPVFMVFDISPEGDGTPKSNVREVRPKGAPSMTWGYVDGRQSHLGFAASQGMQSANMFPGYKIWYEDRADIFVEDMSRMVLIEELPLY